MFANFIFRTKRALLRFACNFIPFKEARIRTRNALFAKFNANEMLVNSSFQTHILKRNYNESIIINSDDTPQNAAKRALVRDILYTKYNENDGKALHDYFAANRDKPIHKWYMYFDAYERHFARFRGREISVLEIGVQNGGSARMWREYFGAGCQIYGIDIDERCKNLESEGIKIFIGSQENRDFWAKIRREIPKVDILIDDGGHTMAQQIVTFEEAFSLVKDGGVYLCEDLHTSYWQSWGGVSSRLKASSNTPKTSSTSSTPTTRPRQIA